MLKKILFLLFLISVSLCAAPASKTLETKVSFAPGWDRSKWLTVQSPRWKASAKWKQEKDCVINLIPGDPGSAYSRPVPGGDYISMLCKQPVTGNVRVEMTCSFLERMAPLMVISPKLTPVYREHIEVVVFDQGINVWHHMWKNNKPSWKLIAFHAFDMKPDKKYKLSVELNFSRRGTFLCFGIGTAKAAVRMPDSWPKTNYFGITACEGRNRFYDFKITGIDQKSPVRTRLPIRTRKKK